MSPHKGTWRYEYDSFGRRVAKYQQPQENQPQPLEMPVKWTQQMLRSYMRHINPEASNEDFAKSGKNPTACKGMRFIYHHNQLVAEVPTYAADGNTALQHEANWNEAIYWLYQQDGFTPTARYQNGQLHYTVADQVGTITELLTEDGYIDYRQKLNLWGEAEIDGHRHYAANDTNALKCNHRFVGQYYDEESGLHYNRFRYYSPETGQYLSHDPIGLRGGFNPYGYVGIPTAFVDPLGLAVCGQNSNQPGRSGNAKIDRAAEELNSYVQRASKMADKGIHMNTAWGKIYSSWKNNQYMPQWLKNVARGNAIQQITDKLAFNPNNPNRYLTELAQLGGYTNGIPRNVGGIWAPLRPDYHFRLPDGNGGYRYGVFDITTPGQAPKIGKYSNQYTDWFINITY